MLCLDETTPVIMALSLLGAVLLIVGGSLWGSGEAAGKVTQTAAGIGLFCASLVLLGLAGLGCWCNQCFCTPERKSNLAKRFYGGSHDGANKKPGDAEAGEDEDAADCGSLGSSFRSFRSFRRASTRRQSRSAGSLRRDRVRPGPATTAVTEGHAPESATPTAIPEQPEPSTQGELASSHNATLHEQQPQIQQTSIDDVSVDEASSIAETSTPNGTSAAVPGASELPPSESPRDTAPVSC